MFPELSFQGLLEAAPDAFVCVDRMGRIVLVNSQAERLFDYRREELIGRPVEMLVPDAVRDVHSRHRAHYLCSPVTRPMGAGLQLAARRRDGTEFPAEISLSAVQSDDGPIVSAVIRDVSERMRAELEVRAAREEADRANRAKSDFLSRMSHELRTPLNAILGFAQLLELDELSSQQADSVHHILSGGNHLLALVDEVLEISRIEAGRLNVSLEPVLLAEVVDKVVGLLQPLAAERHVALQVDEEASRDALVLADRQRFKQVLLNLVSNAVKYNRTRGRVTISWHAGRGRRVRVSVTDTGMGIPAAHLGRLFLPFERLDAVEGDVRGTGLGLALSKGLVESMGGCIGVESETQVGSTFWVELDASEERVQQLSAALPVADEHRPGRAALRILYVEDNLPNLRLVEQVLARRYDVEMIPTLQGGMALDLAKQHRPDVVLLDLHLPDIPGEEILDRLRADPATAGIPVVVISADATPKRISRLMAHGAAGYVTKPLNVRRFLELLEDALTGGEMNLAGDPATALLRASRKEVVQRPESRPSA
jgi:PAS domain S-box-containing protein